jgi:choline dehydrogenase
MLAYSSVCQFLYSYTTRNCQAYLNLITVTYIDSKGHRVTTENSYLTPDVLARPNLTIAIGATVTRLLFDDKSSDDETEKVPRVVGVEFTTTKRQDGPRYRVRTRKEVVLSCVIWCYFPVAKITVSSTGLGHCILHRYAHYKLVAEYSLSIYAKQILMLSGIGPAAELVKHDIPVISDLPGVGAHLMDHATTDVLFKDKSGQSLVILKPRSISEAFRALPHVIRWFASGKGGYTCNVLSFSQFDNAL